MVDDFSLVDFPAEIVLDVDWGEQVVSRGHELTGALVLPLCRQFVLRDQPREFPPQGRRRNCQSEAGCYLRRRDAGVLPDILDDTICSLAVHAV